MLIGYARVSRAAQNLDLQLDALRKAGCERIFRDKGVSGSKASRPELDKALAALQPGDTLVVWRLDRFGRSLTHLITAITDLGKHGIAFRSLHDPIDTTNASGRLVLHMLATLAEFERSLLVERTQGDLRLRSRSASTTMAPRIHLWRRPARAARSQSEGQVPVPLKRPPAGATFDQGWLGRGAGTAAPSERGRPL